MNTAPLKMLGEVKEGQMAHFKKIDAAGLAAEKALRDYLSEAQTIKLANHGGTFVGNRSIAPQVLRSYGIVLSKGGMILPHQEPAEIKAALDEWRSQRSAQEQREALARWEENKAEILPLIEGLKRYLHASCCEDDGGNAKILVYQEEFGNRTPVGWKLDCGPYGGYSRWLHVPVPFVVMEEIARRWKVEDEAAEAREAEKRLAEKRQHQEKVALNIEGLKTLGGKLEFEGIGRVEMRPKDGGQFDIFICFETADGEIERRVGCCPAHADDPEKVEAEVRATCAVIKRVQDARERHFLRFREILCRACEAECEGFYMRTLSPENESSYFSGLLTPAPGCDGRVDLKNGRFSVGLAINENGTPAHSSYYPGGTRVACWDDELAVKGWLDSWEEKVVKLEREFEALIALIPADCSAHALFIHKNTSNHRASLHLCATFGGLHEGLKAYARTQRIADAFMATAKARGAVDYVSDPEEFLRRCAAFGFFPEEKEDLETEEGTIYLPESPDGYRPASSYKGVWHVRYRSTSILGGVLKTEQLGKGRVG